MKNLWMLIVFCLSVFSASLSLAELSPQNSKALTEAGIAIYPGSVSLSGGFGISFATADSKQTVRTWYLKKQTGWSVFEDASMWVLYKGKKGLNPMQIMMKAQLIVAENKNLPIVHSLKEDMTTEIAIILPSK